MGGVTMTCCITDEKLINEKDPENDKKFSETIYNPLVYSYPAISNTPQIISRNISAATTIPNQF